jgi:hypothetical protein
MMVSALGRMKVSIAKQPWDEGRGFSRKGRGETSKYPSVRLLRH